MLYIEVWKIKKLIVHYNRPTRTAPSRSFVIGRVSMQPGLLSPLSSRWGEAEHIRVLLGRILGVERLRLPLLLEAVKGNVAFRQCYLDSMGIRLLHQTIKIKERAD